MYLGVAWRAFGFSPLVTRVAMVVVAACTIAGAYVLGRRVGNKEIGCWSALLLALSPLFFAQSTLAHIDLAAGFFTLLALLTLLGGQPWGFALTSSCAVLSKETAVILLPVAWIFSWWEFRRTGSRPTRAWWIAYVTPLLILAGWAGFYHHVTGIWAGSPNYLQYNLYSTLNPVRVFLTLLRRLYETFVGGFHWLLTAGASAGIWWSRRSSVGLRSVDPHVGAEHVYVAGLASNFTHECLRRRLFFLVGWLAAAYLAMLSLVGGAVLPRYLLPIFPPLAVAAVILVWRLPRLLARSLMVVTAVCFMWAWFLNPPYPFPFEDNLAYADFIRIHERAAQYLEAVPGHPRILTAWPASDELSRPSLGYVGRPLNVVGLGGFTRDEFDGVSPESFDCLYLYSRRWEPPNGWLMHYAWLQRLQERYFQYRPQISEQQLTGAYHLKLLASFERRGQWARIYVRQ
jgi:4-amino-4-deoxy-L-arabinose transferase-like glycosyltransferase